MLSAVAFSATPRSALSGLRQPAPLPESAIKDFKARGFCVVPNWLDASATDAVLRDAALCKAEGLPRQAGIGSTRTGNTAIRQDTRTRRSSMLPLIPPPRPSAGDIDTRLALSSAVSSLRAELAAVSAELTLPGYRLSKLSWRTCTIQRAASTSGTLMCRLRVAAGTR